MAEDDGLADLKVTTITQDQFNETAKPRTPPKAAPKKTPLPAWKDGVISAFMTNMYTTAGKLIEPYNEPYGFAFQAIAETAGDAWEDCAKDSPALRRFIHNLMTTSKMSKLLMAHMPLFIVAMHQHGPLRQVTEDVADRYARDNAA